MSNMLTREQVTQLLAPIRPIRVLKDPRGMSHVSQQDVTAHLTRVFGFGNFDTEVIHLDLVFEDPYVRNGEPVAGKYNVCYRCHFRLTVKNPDGSYLAHYEDASCGDAQNQNRQDAHDLAMKSAISTAKKRCAINLGDQFGLSLYNKGQMTALVKGTLILPDGEGTGGDDMQDGIEQQVSMGVDEVEKQTDLTSEQAENLRVTLGAELIGEEEPQTSAEAELREKLEKMEGAK